MRILLASVLALVLSISLHFDRPVSILRQDLGLAAYRPELLGAPDLALIDEMWGLMQVQAPQAQAIVIPVTVTAYSSSASECDEDPHLTASNRPVRHGIIALSRDLLKRYTPEGPFDWGDRVHLEGVGEFVVEDAMSPRYSKRADIWCPDSVSAIAWGVQVRKLSVPPADPWCF